MILSPTEVMSSILNNPTDLQHVKALVSEDVRYVSLNDDNTDLQKIMPWCGTWRGAESIVKTFVDVGRYWEKLSLDVEDLFGSGEDVAIFGHFTYRSRVLSKIVTSPFAVFGKVTDGRCTYMRFMEDTFATGASFRRGGSWTFESNPDGEVVAI